MRYQVGPGDDPQQLALGVDDQEAADGGLAELRLDLLEWEVGRYGHDAPAHEVGDGPVRQVGVLGGGQGHVAVSQEADGLAVLQHGNGSAVLVAEDQRRLRDRAER